MPLTTTYQPVLSIAAVIEPLTIETPDPSVPLPPPTTGTGSGSASAALGGFAMAASGTVTPPTAAFIARRSTIGGMALPMTRRRLL